MNFWLNKGIIDECNTSDPFGWLWCKLYQQHHDESYVDAIEVAWEEIYSVLAEVMDE